MATFNKFLYNFLAQFFSGWLIIFDAIGRGFKQIFNIPAYEDILSEYKSNFSGPEWVLTVISIGLVLLLMFLIFFLIFLIIRKYFKLRKNTLKQDELVEEIGNLNGQVAKLMKEKEDILAMKVSQLGLKPDESPTEDTKEQGNDKDSENSEDIGT